MSENPWLVSGNGLPSASNASILFPCFAGGDSGQPGFQPRLRMASAYIDGDSTCTLIDPTPPAPAASLSSTTTAFTSPGPGSLLPVFCFGLSIVTRCWFG